MLLSIVCKFTPQFIFPNTFPRVVLYRRLLRLPGDLSGSNVRYIYPLCEVSADAKSNGSSSVTLCLHLHYSADPSHPKKAPLSPCGVERFHPCVSCFVFMIQSRFFCFLDQNRSAQLSPVPQLGVGHTRVFSLTFPPTRSFRSPLKTSFLGRVSKSVYNLYPGDSYQPPVPSVCGRIVDFLRILENLRENIRKTDGPHT